MNELITVPMSPELKAAIERTAAARGLKMAQYMRQATINALAADGAILPGQHDAQPVPTYQFIPCSTKGESA